MGSRSMSMASLKDALFRVRRSSLCLVFASVAFPALADDFSNVATLSPSLEARMAPSFQFNNGLTQSDVATAAAHAYSHLHASKQQKLEAAFERVEKRAVIDPKKVAQQLAKAKRASAAGMPAVAFKGNDKATRRVADAVAPAEEKPVVLAYASAAPVEDDTPLAAIAAIAPIVEETDEITALPDSVPLPDARPRVVQEDEPDKPGERAVRDEPAAKPKPGKNDVAMVRPDKPAPGKPDSPKGSFSDSLRNIFGGGVRSGNGIAVYDIAAAKVYMPDGSVLEAHSGIGKMADNPKYQHVKMKGPTPAHTYNLRMRERRFHGVEAIRMLPVDGRNKFGRDGFLTHSYLLRGRRGQSHGCVAFKDYNKFLRAFKQGKVKKMIVVPSGGAAVARRGAKGAGA